MVVTPLLFDILHQNNINFYCKMQHYCLKQFFLSLFPKKIGVVWFCRSHPQLTIDYAISNKAYAIFILGTMVTGLKTLYMHSRVYQQATDRIQHFIWFHLKAQNDCLI